MIALNSNQNDLKIPENTSGIFLFKQVLIQCKCNITVVEEEIMGDKTVQINFRIDEETLDALKQIARKCSYKEKKDISHTDLIREAIERLIDENK